MPAGLIATPVPDRKVRLEFMEKVAATPVKYAPPAIKKRASRMARVSADAGLCRQCQLNVDNVSGVGARLPVSRP
jgi:hypothetical protein